MTTREASTVRSNRPLQAWFLTAGLAVSLLAAGAMAHAVGTGDINACVARDGSLRIAGDSSGCKKGESPLTWNQQGPVGPKGEPGEPGLEGPAGSPGGLAGYEISTQTVELPPASDDQRGTIAVHCAEGKKALNGGIKILDPDGNRSNPDGSLSGVWELVQVRYSDVLPDGSGWETYYNAQYDADVAPAPGYSVQAYAICADVQPYGE